MGKAQASSEYRVSSLYAYSVSPTRTSEESTPPSGGPCEHLDGLTKLIQDAIAAADFGHQPEIAFKLDPTTRTSEVRDAVLDCAFESALISAPAALRLASRLSSSMDERSHECLLVVAVEEAGAQRRISLWTFPRDTAFRFSVAGKKSRLDVLADVFSQSSKLRKAAMFEGVNNRTNFLDGRVVDNQLSSTMSSIAGFWIDRFLGCSLSITSSLGTRLVTRAIRAAVDAAPDTATRVELAHAVIALRQSNQTSWSPKKIASQFMSPTVKDLFLKHVGEGERSATFKVDRNEFDRSLNFRVFQLENGVVVSAPFDQVDHGVTLEVKKDGSSSLKCQGIVKSEKIRSRHA